MSEKHAVFSLFRPYYDELLGFLTQREHPGAQGKVPALGFFYETRAVIGQHDLEAPTMEINQPAPVIRVPALMDGTLTYLSTADLHTGCVALCFLPRFGDLQWLMLEHRAAEFQAQDSVLVGVISEDLILSGPWHRRLWPCGLTLVSDPLRRLARSYGLISRHTVTRCHSFMIDPQGMLRYHLVHDPTDSGFRALLEMVSCEPDTGIQRVTKRQAAYGVQKSVGRF